jgi:hypothetical protein
MEKSSFPVICAPSVGVRFCWRMRSQWCVGWQGPSPFFISDNCSVKHVNRGLLRSLGLQANYLYRLSPMADSLAAQAKDACKVPPTTSNNLYPRSIGEEASPFFRCRQCHACLGSGTTSQYCSSELFWFQHATLTLQRRWLFIRPCAQASGWLETYQFCTEQLAMSMFRV